MEPTRRCGPFSVWTSSWFYLSLLVNCHSQITTLATWSWQTQIHLWQPVAIAIPDNRTHRFKFLNVATGQNAGADWFRCVVAFGSLEPNYNDTPSQILAQPIKNLSLLGCHSSPFRTKSSLLFDCKLFLDNPHFGVNGLCDLLKFSAIFLPLIEIAHHSGGEAVIT